jgi:hypothetical protein
VSIATTASQLQALLEGITIPRLAKVYGTPRESADIGSFPTAVVGLDPELPHRWSMAAHGLARHDYTMAIWLFVGGRANVPLQELVSRCEAWPEPVATVLFADYTLRTEAGLPTVEWVGDGGTGELLSYTMGVFEWAGRELFGLKFSLQVTEKIVKPMAP